MSNKDADDEVELRVDVERTCQLERALQQAKVTICPFCAAGDPMSLDEDGVDRKGEYHSFFGGNEKCRAAFILPLLPNKNGQPIRRL